MGGVTARSATLIFGVFVFSRNMSGSRLYLLIFCICITLPLSLLYMCKACNKNCRLMRVAQAEHQFAHLMFCMSLCMLDGLAIGNNIMSRRPLWLNIENLEEIISVSKCAT